MSAKRGRRKEARSLREKKLRLQIGGWIVAEVAGMLGTLHNMGRDWCVLRR